MSFGSKKATEHWVCPNSSLAWAAQTVDLLGLRVHMVVREVLLTRFQYVPVHQASALNTIHHTGDFYCYLQK